MLAGLLKDYVTYDAMSKALLAVTAPGNLNGCGSSVCPSNLTSAGPGKESVAAPADSQVVPPPIDTVSPCDPDFGVLSDSDISAAFNIGAYLYQAENTVRAGDLAGGVADHTGV